MIMPMKPTYLKVKLLGCQTCERPETLGSRVERMRSLGSSPPPRSASSPRPTQGSLRREGIVPASQRTIAGSAFGKAAPSPHRASSQQATEEKHIRANSSGSISSSSSTRRPSKTADIMFRRTMFLHRNDWINLGEGWFQVTAVGSGATNRAGLHSVLESLAHHPYSCLYIPRSDGAYQACVSNTPEYDLELQTKVMTSKPAQSLGIMAQFAPPPSSQAFLLLFAYKTRDDHCAIRCDALSKTWQLLRVYGGQEELLCDATDDTFKSNAFSSLLLQVRGSYVSLDVNGQPLFTKVRVRSAASLGGIMGLYVEGSKIAIKGWKLRGLQTNLSLNRSAISATEEVSMTPPVAMQRRPSSGSVSGIATGGASLPANYRPPAPPIGEEYGPGTSNRAPARMSLSEALQAKRSSALQPSPRGLPRPPSAALMDPEAHVEREQSMDDVPKPAINRGVSSAVYQQLVALNDSSLVDWVLQDIVQTDIGVSFNDIAALDRAKRLLHEAIVLPLVMPEFFTGIREPWKGVLLFGPPGTGKTMLAKAVCSLQNSTFFNCSASTLVSKYRGETEKIVRVLFQAARHCAPSVIFIDELDAIMGDRDKGQEHEASRRLKTELFAQIDGLGSHTQEDGGGSSGGGADMSKRVVLLAATNCPWDLDPAMRRRLEKRIYIPLPDDEARAALLQILLRNIPVSTDVNPQQLVELTRGFSGSDIQIICRDASMMPMRRLLDHFSAQDLVEMKRSGDLLVPKVTMADFHGALQNTRPSVTATTVLRYEKWEEEFSNK